MITSVIPTNQNQLGQLTLRPAASTRIVGWALAAFGVIFALAGFAAGDFGGGITMAVGGLLFALLGASMATAALTVDAAGVRYRHGRSTSVSAENVVAVSVGEGSGASYPRAVLVIDREAGRAMRLTALQRPGTRKGRDEVMEQARSVARTLGRPELIESRN